MKAKFLPAVLLISIISISATAQIKPVLKAGIINATWKGEAKETFTSVIDQTNGIIEPRKRTGFYIGAGADIPLGEIVSIEPGLVYTQRGYGLKGNLTINKLKIEALNARATSQMHYIDLPVLIKVKPAGGLTIFAGPQISYLVKNNLQADVALLGFSLINTDLDITNQFNKFDVGITGGIGYEFEGGFGIAASYEKGFNRLDKNQNFKVFNEGIKAGFTYKF